MNYSLFIQKGRGNQIRDNFSEYTDFKQTLPSVTAGVIMLAIVVGTGFSLIAYRHAHGFTA